MRSPGRVRTRSRRGRSRQPSGRRRRTRSAAPFALSSRESVPLPASWHGLSRGQAELPKHPQLIRHSPVLRDLAVDDLYGVRLRPLRVFSGGGHPKYFALMGPADRQIGSHEVALGDLKIDAVVEVRESFAQRRCDGLDAFATTGNAGGKLAVLGKVGRQEFVNDLEASLRENLDGDTPCDRLVLL